MRKISLSKYKFCWNILAFWKEDLTNERIHLISPAIYHIERGDKELISLGQRNLLLIGDLTRERERSLALSRDRPSDPRSTADAYEIYYATFIAIKSGNAALRLSYDSPRCLLTGVDGVPTFVVEIGILGGRARRESDEGREGMEGRPGGKRGRDGD